MSKKLAVWISILVTIVLVFSTGVYYSQSEKVILSEIQKRAAELLRADKRTVSDFLSHINSVTYGLYVNPINSEFIFNNVGQQQVESLFMDYCANLKDVQAIRLVDKNGLIKVFMRECENLSGMPSYEPINIISKDFIQDAATLKQPETLYSKFERGFLPDAVSFCPSMIRTVTPYFDKEGVNAGYLVVNFWGERLGEVANRINTSEGHAFIVEKNKLNPERHGIFLFHRNKSYEFANQMKHNHRVQTVYGEDVFNEMVSGLSGIIRLPNGDFLAYTTVYPYDGTDISWKISTIMDANYAFRNLKALKTSFIIILSLSVFLAVLTSFIFAARFLKPLDGLIKALESYGKGELDYQLEGNYSDELGEITEKIKEMAKSLRAFIQERESAQKKMELADRLASLSILSAGVSHELSTPLNSILLAANLLKKEYGDTLEVEAVKTQAERCVEIIASMKRLILKPSEKDFNEKINLKNAVEEIIRFMRVGKGIVIETELEEAYIEGSRSLISQAILNIAINAVDAVYPEGKVVFRLFVKDKKVIFEAEDSGEGIEPEKLEKIFDPFFTTKSPDKGTGLGLSITHRIVTEHGGRINVFSKISSGTTVRCEFNESCNS